MVASDSMLANTCAGCHGTNGHSHDYSISVAAVYRLNENGDKITKVSGGLTPGNADADTLKREAAYAHSSFTNITSDLFG